MRCLGDVSRGMCEVTRSFLLELSCCCGLERDTWMIHIACKACCVNRYTSVGGDCARWIVREIHVDPWLCIVRLGIEQQYGESPDV